MSVASLVTSLDPLNAKQEARKLEQKCFDEATSKDDYQERITTLINDITADENAEGLNVELHEEFVSSSIVTIGKYTHAQHYRDGLFSSVFKAHTQDDSNGQSQTHSLVALKVTKPSLMEPPHDSVREARILASCEHDHVIPLLDSFRQAGGRFVLVLPFVPYDLAALLQKGCLSNRQITSTIQNLFGALAYLHSHGIIHRDVKPSNILLSAFNGPAYLADFGIAWSPRDAACETPNEKITDVGTTSYRAPELLFGNTSYNESLDLWAAGCVVAEAMSKPHKTLFESGDLGSELALIQSVFQTLGTPSTATWPEAAIFRDWGKMAFHEYPTRQWNDILPNASPGARDLVSQLVCFESSTRISAEKALAHPMFMR